MPCTIEDERCRSDYLARMDIDLKTGLSILERTTPVICGHAIKGGAVRDSLLAVRPRCRGRHCRGVSSTLRHGVRRIRLQISQQNALIEFPELTINPPQPVLQLDIIVRIERGGTLGVCEREGWPLNVFAYVRRK